MPKFNDLVIGLAKLPVELAHQIIGDLLVYDVLKLLWYDDPTVVELIKSHPHYKIILGDNEKKSLQTKNSIKSLISLHAQLDFFAQLDGSLYRPRGGPLASNAQAITFDGLRRWTLSDIARDIKSPAKALLLEQFLTTPLDRYVDRSVYPNGVPNPRLCETVEELERCISAVKHAKTRMIQRSTDQLYFAANILEKNPDLLKRTLDPEQKRRANIAHVVNRMRKTADKTKSRNWRSFTPNEHFSYEFFPVIPYDSALVELLRNLEKHGLSSGKESRLLSDEEQSPQTSHSQSIKDQIDFLMEGMPFYFTDVPFFPIQNIKAANPPVTDDKGDVFRTKNTFTSEDNDDAYFAVHNVLPSLCYKRPTYPRPLEPCDDREERWLTSFVDVYRYLENLEKIKSTAA